MKDYSDVKFEIPRDLGELLYADDVPHFYTFEQLNSKSMRDLYEMVITKNVTLSHPGTITFVPIVDSKIKIISAIDIVDIIDDPSGVYKVRCIKLTWDQTLFIMYSKFVNNRVITQFPEEKTNYIYEFDKDKYVFNIHYSEIEFDTIMTLGIKDFIIEVHDGKNYFFKDSIAGINLSSLTRETWIIRPSKSFMIYPIINSNNIRIYGNSGSEISIFLDLDKLEDFSIDIMLFYKNEIDFSQYIKLDPNLLKTSVIPFKELYLKNYVPYINKDPKDLILDRYKLMRFRITNAYGFENTFKSFQLMGVSNPHIMKNSDQFKDYDSDIHERIVVINEDLG